MSHTARAEVRRPPPGPPVAPPVDPGGDLDAGASLSQDGRHCTEEEYWRIWYHEREFRYEWNDGRLEEKPVSDYETLQVYHWFLFLLDHFLSTRPVAWPAVPDMGFRLALPTGTVIRRPDLALVLRDNPQPILPRDESYRGRYDLCIEVLSDRDRAGIERDTVTKKSEYAAAGVAEYYILHPRARHQAFYTLTDAGVYVPIAPVDGVICSRVLSGFRFRPADLGRRPAHATLRGDPVYAGFVLPGWQAAEARAAAESRRAQEAVRARQEAEARAAADVRRAEAETEARRAAEARAREAEAALARLRGQMESGDPLSGGGGNHE